VAHHGRKPLDEMDRLLVRFGCEILQIIPGRVSTEVDARLSFDTAATVARGERIVALYKAEGIGTERVLIKVAATWEGIQAARSCSSAASTPTSRCCSRSPGRGLRPGQGAADLALRRPHLRLVQEVGRRGKWDEAASAGANDPGVKSVREIYKYYKHFGIATEVMGASFRNVGQILALAGCDLLTISPELLAQLAASDAPLQRALDAKAQAKR
jgi:transaldolase